MRFLPLALGWGLLGWSALGWAAAAPQSPPREPPVRYACFTDLRVTFTYKASMDQDKPAEVHLHVSKDGGKTWETAQKTRPEEGHFIYRAPKDGEYWLMSRTKYQSGKYLPAGPPRAEVKVIVDTAQPTLDLEAVRGEGGEVHVRWKLHDANLAPESFKIEYQPAGAKQAWQRVAVEPLTADEPGAPHEGEIAFVPQGRPELGGVIVRAEAADRAGNRAIVERTASPAGAPVDGDKLVDRKRGQLPPADEGGDSESGPQLGPSEGSLPPPPAMADQFPGSAGAGQTPFPAAAGDSPYPRTENADWPPKSPASPANEPPEMAATPRQEPPPTVSEPVRPPVAAQYSSNPAKEEENAPATAEPLKPGALPAGVRPHMVNKPRFELLYDVESVGSAGISLVELWGTRDGGQTWSSFGVDEDGRSPMLVNVDGEGLYGFRVVVTTGAGVEGAVPTSGDLPDVWVGVDLTKPSGNLVSAEQGAGDEAGHMVISWQAGDERLAARPISLRMSESPDGPWHTIASGLENTGRYLWRVDQRVPAKIYLRLEVRDDAGNVRIDDSTEPVEVQRVRPQGRIRDVRPLGDADRRGRAAGNSPGRG